MDSNANAHEPSQKKDNPLLDPSSSVPLDPANEVVDYSVINELISDIGEGGAEIIIDLIDVYLNHSPTIFAAIDKAFINNDLHTIHRSAHTLKSSSANLGALALSEISRQLEEQLRPEVERTISQEEWVRIKAGIDHKVRLMKESYSLVSLSMRDYQLKLIAGKGQGSEQP
jgi:HPt (histidine-containing phosphotransfer) domain-containing protein